MAKRNKAEEPEEEAYDFIPPEFDEDQFIHKEMVSFHTTAILFLVGIVAALVSWAAFSALDGARIGWLVGMVIVALAFAFLRPLFRLLKVDIAHWARREWIGTAFLLFFTWLAFFIMFVNPPMSDFADPQANLYLTPESPVAGEEATFQLFLHDNVGIDGYDSRLVHEGGMPVDTPALSMVPGDVHHFTGNATLPAGTYTWFVTAHDENGRSQDANLTFTVGNGLAIEVDSSDAYPVQARVPGDAKDYWAVYADIEGGDRVYLEFKEDLGFWVATPNFKGWNTGNNTFTIVAEEKNAFDNGQTLVRGGLLTDGPHELEVTSPGDYTKHEPKKPNKTTADAVNIPGFEVVALLAGLVAVAAIARRRS